MTVLSRLALREQVFNSRTGSARTVRRAGARSVRDYSRCVKPIVIEERADSICTCVSDVTTYISTCVGVVTTYIRIFVRTITTLFIIT